MRTCPSWNSRSATSQIAFSDAVRSSKDFDEWLALDLHNAAGAHPLGWAGVGAALLGSTGALGTGS